MRERRTRCSMARERLWTYLLGKSFTIETDNRAVKLIFTNTRSKPPAQIERLALSLSQFDFEIVHKPGESNVADYYSRHPVRASRDEFLDEIRASAEAENYINAIAAANIPRSVTIEEVREATSADSQLQEVLNCWVERMKKTSYLKASVLTSRSPTSSIQPRTVYCFAIKLFWSQQLCVTE